MSSDLVHELFSSAAARVPDSTAVCCEGERLSYRELEERSDEVAAALLDRGLTPGALVGICVQRSPAFALGLLAILKSGAAYLPLDPAQPPARLRTLIEDAKSRLVLCDERSRAVAAQLGVANVLIETARGGTPVAKPRIQPDDLAYVLYTSGSTGYPKGVAVPHRSLVAYVKAISARLKLPAGASFATVSTFAADLGNTAIFGALCTGGTLHIVTRERAADPVGLGAYMADQQIDCLKIVPSHLAALLAADSLPAPLPARVLVLGGEVCPWSLARRVREICPQLRVLNHYGPTEATVGVLTYEIPAGALPSDGNVPLGRALDGAVVRVVDRTVREAPLGTEGEIAIGGPTLARGYLGQPSLTSERFVVDPASAERHRLYLTGDRARRDPDGLIHFIGRMDDQVKIRGYRVEPAEVASVLRDMPGIADAFVQGVRSERGVTQLVAYVVPALRPLDLAALDALTRERLPDHMVPSAIVVLERWPLTANGKVDRAALPSTREPSTIEPSTPHDDAERILLAIWNELLGRADVGREQNFFELGGDSLLAIRLVGAASRAGLALRVRDVFQHQTVAALAAVARDQRAPV